MSIEARIHRWIRPDIVDLEPYHVPDARGMTLTMGILAISLSRLMIAPVAAWLMINVSFAATCLVGALGTAGGVLVLALWARED